MNVSKLNDAILCICQEYSIKYIDLLTTLDDYSLLPSQLKSKYSKVTKYKSPAVRLLAEKYNINSSNFHSKNKMKIFHIKYEIKIFEEKKRNNLEKKYLYLTFIKKLGLNVGIVLVKNCFN